MEIATLYCDVCGSKECPFIGNLSVQDRRVSTFHLCEPHVPYALWFKSIPITHFFNHLHRVFKGWEVGFKIITINLLIEDEIIAVKFEISLTTMENETVITVDQKKANIISGEFRKLAENSSDATIAQLYAGCDMEVTEPPGDKEKQSGEPFRFRITRQFTTRDQSNIQNSD